MKEFIPNIITGVCTLIGALGGVYWTQKGNKDSLKQQIIRDEMKEKRNELKEALEIYNRILKVSRERSVIIDNGGLPEEFNFNVYQKEVRPILYEKYHLLHDEVAKIVTDIDSIIGYMYFGGGDDRTEHMNLGNKYNKLIENIEQRIRDFRKGDRS
ncbi:hypothetical protein [Bacillus cereus]|uniref:hypothetical protein n=1 Tax=Bacillus cereus TaxID=1396 RepID=UPI000BF4E514|nr:hypothetical protein [Bacillus cereus]PFF63976.1 hypothetical protein CN350_01250 [Bacillus cereus]PFL15307.1 hypothetical protein COJ24_04590 [Bacillus cereus]PFQ03522.1 hypothetical protein COK14_30110 [Bacillus cereus]PGR01004.1 hypothetical protein COA24_11340 [Bacillus cereus]